MFIGKQMRNELPRKRIGGLLLLAVMLGAVVWLMSGPGDGASAAGTNDAFAKATATDSTFVTTTQNNAGYTTEAGEPLPCGAKGATAWFRHVRNQDATMTFNTGGSLYDTVLAVYTGAVLTNLTNVSCKNDVVGVGAESITFAAKAGVTYYLQVGGASGAAGSMTLNAIGAAGDAIPHLINYQGRLTDGAGTPVADGGYNITFRIYNGFDPAYSVLQWTETQKVAVSGGLFSVLLGTNTPITPSVFSPSGGAGRTRFLEVQVAGDPPMSPRQRLATVPYAIQADSLEGSTGSSVMPISEGWRFNDQNGTEMGILVNNASVGAGSLLLNGQVVELDHNGPDEDQALMFYDDGIVRNEELRWSDATDSFRFSNDLFAVSFTATSDRNAKANFGEVNERDILERVADLPIETWNFKDDQSVTPHIGPSAQDFKAAFKVGVDDKTISTTDADGVAFASIQALYDELKVERTRNDSLEQRLSALEGGGGASPQAAASASSDGVSWLTIVLPLLALFAIPAGGLLGGWAGRRARS